MRKSENFNLDEKIEGGKIDQLNLSDLFKVSLKE